MIVREVVIDAKTGEATERLVYMPDVITEADGLVLTQEMVRQETNAASLLTQADQALLNLRAYRDNASPTTAQTVAAVKLLCRVAIALIRLRLAKFEATD